ncbi:hypothetical protein SARC_01868 [Sphaeroforma arctica JP610]|uniref:VHS domain-containing protein n=1 Tax=Sphaeroforma arctica JP610 TaxID=667725 RepID=A0A0L0GCH2_9EUKA|nr:hypothetical protein SARC_01868 [Sphaeroforma arctica JP610]KNC85963.1 hypothetical protein SARC_01868 [Sphaeroforma arctica JP610]|eukprot:XP_014159865.1 hypothetical protein SARC_01868 [Sphaeroforma arctica JP610]
MNLPTFSIPTNIGGFDLDVFALTTTVGKKVEQATSELLVMEDWALNLEITDRVNATDDGPGDAARAIRKRLGNNNERVVTLALNLLEACVQNCGQRFHMSMCQKDVFPSLGKVAEKKSVSGEHARRLLAEWAISFDGKRHLFPELYTVHAELLSKSIEFPEINPNTVTPIHMAEPDFAVPDTEITTQQQQSPLQPHNTSQRIVPTDAQITKLADELEIVKGNADVLDDMVNALDATDNPTDSELLSEIVETTRAMHQRVVTLISQVDNDQIMNTLLLVNDQLVHGFDEYEKKLALYQTSQKAMAPPSTAQRDTADTTKPPTTATNDPTTGEADLIVMDTPATTTPNASTVSQTEDLADDFDGLDLDTSTTTHSTNATDEMTEEDFDDFLGESKN